MSLSAPCTTRSRIVGIDRTRTFPPSFGISCFRTRMGRYVLLTNSSWICLRKLSAPLSSMASNVNPVYSRRPAITLRHLVSFPQRLHLADMDVQSPEPPSLFSLGLDI